MTSGPVRVRFAPSPTGHLHVGGARTALFNWLTARGAGGTLVLRVEDTDLERSTEESVAGILDSLSWLGLDWDEGPRRGGPHAPYFQSERREVYRQYLAALLEQGQAYPCFCLPEELEERKEAARLQGLLPRYDRRCRPRAGTTLVELEAGGRPFAIRFMMPDEGVIPVEDVIRGEISFECQALDDFVLLKSDGMPTYNFACAVDDLEMSISHVIRGDDHLSNTPKQVAVYRALGAQPPLFAHVPMILGPDRSRLSKRHGATSVDAYRHDGILPAAMVNYLALLGWSYDGKQEIFDLEELIAKFDLTRVSRTPAIFDRDKLVWLNGHYIRSLKLDDFVRLSLPGLEAAGLVEPRPAEQELGRIKRVLAVTQERVRTLAEVPYHIEYFFRDPEVYDPKGVKKHFKGPETARVLTAVRDRLETVEPFEAEVIEQACRDLAAASDLNSRQIIHPVRLAVTGRTFSPGLFETLELVGKERVLGSLSRAAHWLAVRSED